MNFHIFTCTLCFIALYQLVCLHMENPIKRVWLSMVLTLVVLLKPHPISNLSYKSNIYQVYNWYTVEPRFNEPPFNEVLHITNKNLCPGQNYSKMYGIQPRYNQPRFSEFLDMTNIIRKPKHKIFLDNN